MKFFNGVFFLAVFWGRWSIIIVWCLDRLKLSSFGSFIVNWPVGFFCTKSLLLLMLQFVFLPAFLWLRTAFHVFLFISCCFCYYYIIISFCCCCCVMLCCVVLFFLLLSLYLWYVIKSNSDDYTWAKVLVVTNEDERRSSVERLCGCCFCHQLLTV